MSEVSAEKTSATSEKCTNDETTSNNEDASKEKKIMKVDNDDVQRAIEGLAEIPDDQLQEFLNDEDFVQGLDVVDAWEGDSENNTRPCSGEPPSKEPPIKESPSRKSSRERPRKCRRREQNRDRIKKEKEGNRREDSRRDPCKSSKDIERDKLRTRKDTASKALAEKEKAIKTLLESDDVVPPGTEVEVLQEQQQNSEKVPPTPPRARRSRERRRFSSPRKRSSDRNRPSPSSRRTSHERRHDRQSPERRRNVQSPALRRSWERRASRDRSLERHRRREEREQRLASRRSRSRDRQRSSERYRKRYSRSPRRGSPNGRRHHSRSPDRRRSRSRTPDRRARKRSPFINEIARQFAADGLIGMGAGADYLAGIPPLMDLGGFGQDQRSGHVAGISTALGNSAPQQKQPLLPTPTLLPQFVHHPGPPRPPMPTGMHPQPVPQPPYMNFENFTPMNFVDPLRPPQPDYSAGPIMYDQATGVNRPMQPPLPSMPMHLDPQPVPPPLPLDHRPTNFNPTPTSRPGRIKTPEPPVISNSKQFEKTSLSSLLEASVSAKDSHVPPVLYPGFKPEILRKCEQALRSLPPEDLRFRSKGRFFYDPTKGDQESELAPSDSSTKSILLRSGRGKIYWDDAQKTSTETSKSQVVEMLPKLCQTDAPMVESVGIQAVLLPKKSDFCAQVYPKDLQMPGRDDKRHCREEKRPIMDRLDWNVRENYPPGPSKARESDDLRWSLSNSSQKRVGSGWNRGSSPLNRDSPPLAYAYADSHSSGNSRGMGSSNRGHDDFSAYDREHRSRDRYSRDRFSPPYQRSANDSAEVFAINAARSDHSRGESPMAIDDDDDDDAATDSPDDVRIIEPDSYSRGNDWRNRGNSSSDPKIPKFSTTITKTWPSRGKQSNRSYRPRGGIGGFRGKF